GQLCVYLDITELPAAAQKKLEGILEIYEKFQGVDPRQAPMKIFPAVHYSMGGLWVDYERDPVTDGLKLGAPRNQMTNVPGLYAIGEADYQYHGANRLGANSLLSCIFSGLLVGPSIQTYVKNLKGASAADMPSSLFEREVKRQHDLVDALINREGTENPYQIHKELGESMTANVTVVRYNDKIRETLHKIDELQERSQRAVLTDKGQWTNQNLSFTRALGDMLVLARVIAQGALQRDECRGAHYKPNFDLVNPQADDSAELRREAIAWCRTFREKNDKWLRTTIAVHTSDGPQMSYEAVDVALIPPRPRLYEMKGAEVIAEVWNEMERSPAAPGEAGRVSERRAVAV
ncbi:MAG TPA: FAD-binding protein, partial [Phycisphaerae bacterium]